jgi:cardiolipin synthase
VNQLLERAAATRSIPGNRVRLLQDGPETYEVMLDLIARATRWIHFENYIIHDDRTGRRFAEALGKRAREGITVQVLYDWFGCAGTPRRFWRDLRSAGVRIRVFNPLSVLAAFGNLERDHRKLVVVDGESAVLGGLCIGDEWMGDPARNISPWRDTAIEVEGPASAALDRAFWRVWERSRGDPGVATDARDVPERGDATVWVLAGEPGRMRTSRVLQLIVTGARERLWIADAYLLPPRLLRQAIADASRDGADVRLMAPASSDLPWIRNLTRIGYRPSLKAGARIFEWDGPMLHAKTLVADGQWSKIGSSNLNAASLIGNYELDVLIEQPELAAAMEAQFRRDIAFSHEVLRQPIRTPVALQEVSPSKLRRHAPELPPAEYRRVRGETRHRAAVSLRRVASGAIRSVYAGLILMLVAAAATFVALPHLTAYLFAGMCAWLAIAATIQLFRRRD